MESNIVKKQSEYRNEIGLLKKKRTDLLNKACAANGSDYVVLMRQLKDIEENTKSLIVNLQKTFL